MSPRTPPTLIDVARHAGVSKATASYALRDHHKIKETTRKRVQESAAALGYRTNRAAAIMASGRFRKTHQVEGCRIALLLPDKNTISYGASALWEIRHGRELAEQMGHELWVIDVCKDSQLGKITDRLYQQGVDGLLLGRQLHLIPTYSEVDWDRFAVISLGIRTDRLSIDVVRPDFYKAVKQGFERLVEAGRRRILGIIWTHDPILQDDRERLAAFLECQHRYFLHNERLPVQCPSFNDPHPDDHDYVRELLKKHRPDGILAFSSRELYALKHCGVRVPGDLAYVALHMAPEPPYEMECSGFHQNGGEVYRRAISALDVAMRQKRRGQNPLPAETLVPPVWIDGKTL